MLCQKVYLGLSTCFAGNLVPGHAFNLKSFQKRKKHRTTYHHQSSDHGRRPTTTSVINPFVPPSVNIDFFAVRAFTKRAYTFVPGHALHEKSSQKQRCDGPLVSSQDERALLVPLINLVYTADKPVVNRGFCFSVGLHKISLVCASGGTFGRRIFDALQNTREACPLGEQFSWHPVLPDAARHPAVRPDPTRPWYVWVLDSTNSRTCLA